MSDNDVDTRVVKIVAEQLSIKEEEVALDASFNEDLGADSLDIIEIVMSLETEFETSIEDEEVEKISTVKEAIDCIKAHLKE
ncbi:MAG: acyl carrier protein [Candidatus Eutrophobiaceae bacterium]